MKVCDLSMCLKLFHKQIFNIDMNTVCYLADECFVIAMCLFVKKRIFVTTVLSVIAPGLKQLVPTARKIIYISVKIL